MALLDNLTGLVIPAWVKVAAPIAAIALAFLVFRFVWLPEHDARVRAEYLTKLTRDAIKDSENASAKADKAAATRKEQTDEVQDRIANSSSVDDLFDRLRANPGAR